MTINYYVVDVEYSMTDKSTVLVKARSTEEAVDIVKASGTTAKYISVVRTIAPGKIYNKGYK